MEMPLGIYISVPFCKTKCSYCNFASGVFSKAVFARYVDRVCEDIKRFELTASEIGGVFEPEADSVYLGGGTPTLLAPDQLQRIFAAVRNRFVVTHDAEVTVECAPGTLSGEMIETLLACGVNRVSLGVQSFIDQEASSVARLHTRKITLEEIERLRLAGIANINIDLIAGLPHQTEASWQESLRQTIDTGVPHASVYMLEVDEDSRLGREVMAGGTRYHAHFVPDDDLTADLYETACGELNRAGIQQYEISNLARAGFESRHNLKYWTRQPYAGFGVDAHSMLEATPDQGLDAVRFATADALEQYTSGAALIRTPVSHADACEEAYFLGLRLTRGIDLEQLAERYGPDAASFARDQIAEFCRDGIMELEGGRLRLTERGRLISNEVFAALIVADEHTVK
jgi:putative oxygen-independent coproporphyrinogen III oxidase